MLMILKYGRIISLFVIISFLTSCAIPRLSVEDSRYLTEVLSKSKRYDNLLDLITKELERVNSASKDTIDLEGKLFLLDDLAEIYTIGLVDFKKAQDVNKEARLVLEEIGKKSIVNLPISPYFNPNRSLYYYFYPGMKVIDQLQLLKLYQHMYKHPGGVRYPYVSLAPLNYLNFIRQNDIDLLRLRLDARKHFLAEKLGRGIPGPIKPLEAEADIKRDLNEAVAIQNFLQKAGIYNEYYLLFYKLARLWQLSYSSKETTLLNELVSSGKKAISLKDSMRDQSEFESLCYIYYWTGISYLKLGDFKAGVKNLEDFVKAIDDHEKKLKESEDRKREALEKLTRKRNIALAVTVLLAIATLGAGMAAAAQTASVAPTTMAGYQAQQAQLQNISQQTSNTISLLAQQAQRISELGITEKKLNEYQSLYAYMLNRFLDKYCQLEFFYELGNAYQNLNDRENAINHYKEAIKIVENHRSTIYTEKQRITYFENKFDIYGRLISLLVECGRAEEGFEYAERAKSRALVDMIGGSQIVFSDKKEEEIYEKLVTSQLEIDSILAQDNISAVQYDVMAKKIERAIKVEPEEREHLEIVSLANVDTITGKEIKDLAGNIFCLVEYFVGEKATIIFLIHDGKIDAFEIPVSRNVIFEKVASFRQRLIEKKWPDESRELFNLLVKPLEPLVVQSKICIVPHSFLHYLPFQALYDGRQYLIEKYKIFYAPSGTILKYSIQKRKTKKESILAVGNPKFADPTLELKYAEEECRLISEEFRRTKVLVSDNATETNLKINAGNYDIVHIATHGYFSSDNPMASYLSLAKDDKNDGLLKASELFTIKLNTYLVTLSACQTGISKVSRGDEIIGLARGIIYSGAPSILASLWNVNDLSTAELMREFYKNLKTMDKASALQMAQLEIIKKYDSPFYWAPFILIGDYY